VVVRTLLMKAVLGLLLLMLATMVAASPTVVTVLYTNDLHVRLDHLEALSHGIDEERRRESLVLLLDAGDAWHDYRRPIYSVWGDARMVAWMNEMAYLAMAVGNHDIYAGSARYSSLLGQAQFPVLCSNWRPMEADDRFRGSTVIEVGEERVLVIGVITAEFLPLPVYATHRYVRPVTAIRAEMAHREGAFDWVFVLGHVGLLEARWIAECIPRIDVFFTGHSHEETTEVILEGTTILVQSGAFGRALGRLRLRLDRGLQRIEVVSNDLLPMARVPVDRREGTRRLLITGLAMAAALLLWWF
jgi:5'-nucleotidase